MCHVGQQAVSASRMECSASSEIAAHAKTVGGAHPFPVAQDSGTRSWSVLQRHSQRSATVGGSGGVAKSPTRKVTRAQKGLTVASAARSAVHACVALVAADDLQRQKIASQPDPLEGTPHHREEKKMRGIFYQHLRGSDVFVEQAQVRRGNDFRRRLETLLSGEGQAEAVARHLHRVFEGDSAKLPALLGLMQERWGFPELTFPMLITLLRRMAGAENGNIDFVIGEDEWVLAFVRWLQVQKTRCGRTKMSRRRLIQKHTDSDLHVAYTFGRRLGEGSFGEVYLATHTNLQVNRVIKSMPVTQLSLGAEQVETEVDTMRSLDHPHIIRIFEAFETEDRLHIVMDFAEGGDLSDAIRVASEEKRVLPQAWSSQVSTQIAAALGYMHARGVIHCDLKPGNVMLLHPFKLSEAEAGTANPHVLVADFGLAEMFRDCADGGQLKGSPSYLAPEGFEGKLSERSDMWSLGVMLYEMLTSTRPFKGTSNLFTLMCQVQNTDPPWDGISDAPLTLVVALMAKDPRVRPSARDCLGFEFLRQPTHGGPPGGLLVAGVGLSSYFHSSVMFCVAAGMGMAEVYPLYKFFRDMDGDLNGCLTLEELRTGIIQSGRHEDLGHLVSALDMDQDGQISFTEFLAGFLSLEGARLDRALRYAFEVFDLDGDMFLDIQDLRTMLSGDGMLAEILPDGQTVEHVMEDVSGGAGRISFQDFQKYIRKHRTSIEREFVNVFSESVQVDAAALASLTVEETVQDKATRIVEELLGSSRLKLPLPLDPEEPATGVRSETTEDFPSFDEWLAELYLDTQEGAALGKLLKFASWPDEVRYVDNFTPSTCAQLALLCTTLVLYSCWALATEGYKWNPMIGRWSSSPVIACNLAWLWLLLTGIIFVVACIAGAKRRFDPAQSVMFERVFCLWATLVPWVSCFFANRYRVSSVFNSDPMETFHSMNSDYDLIVVMLGALMFLSTRTHVRFALTLPIALSSGISYALSSALLGTPYTDNNCGTDRNWAWPAMLLVTVATLGLTGHRAIERQRRLTFLSLLASYNVLKGQNDGDSAVERAAVAKSTVAETRTARLKQAVETTNRLCTSLEFASKPMKAALEIIVQVLESTREDLAHADRLLMVDIREVLAADGVDGLAEELLLCLMDAPRPRRERGNASAASLVSLDPLAITQSRQNLSSTRLHSLALTPPMQSRKSHGGKLRDEWGWDVLAQGISLSVPAGVGELRSALTELLLPAVDVAIMISGAKVFDPKVSVRTQHAAGDMIDKLVAFYTSGSPSAEARAALAVRAAYWLARCLGLWGSLPAWDRVAMLIAAAGLHCADNLASATGATYRSRTGGSTTPAVFTPYPLLGAAASVWDTLSVVDSSGLAGIDTSCQGIRESVRDYMMRARPRCALEDARRVRVANDLDDEASWAERQTIAGLVVAAADFAFLALPAGPHKRWAEVCHREAEDVIKGQCALPIGVSFAVGPEHSRLVFDTAAWLRGLIQTLCLPLYETLAKLDNSGMDTLAGPVDHLRQNNKHWKVTQLQFKTSPRAAPATSEVLQPPSTPLGPRLVDKDEEDVLDSALVPIASSAVEGITEASASLRLAASCDDMEGTASDGTVRTALEAQDEVRHLQRHETYENDHLAEALVLCEVPPPARPGQSEAPRAPPGPMGRLTGIVSAEEGAEELLMGELLTCFGGEVAAYDERTVSRTSTLFMERQSDAFETPQATCPSALQCTLRADEFAPTSSGNRCAHADVAEKQSLRWIGSASDCLDHESVGQALPGMVRSGSKEASEAATQPELEGQQAHPMQDDPYATLRGNEQLPDPKYTCGLDEWV